DGRVVFVRPRRLGRYTTLTRCNSIIFPSIPLHTPRKHGILPRLLVLTRVGYLLSSLPP
ncbi:hypothetical protein JMJ77_0001670, partial [Colletotrichum scovillei]